MFTNLKQFIINHKKTILFFFALWAAAFAFRWFMIRGGHVYFWFDQARDAHVSQQIFLERDLKIQGPSASGTNDTIYHGVLYYYLLGPLYLLFGGNPYLVALAFGAVNSLAVVGAYILGNSVLLSIPGYKKSSGVMGLFLALLLAFNFEHAQFSSWLSNPMIALIPTVVLFWLLWQMFYAFKRPNIAWPWWLALGVTLGVIEQSAFYSVYFWGPVLVGIFYWAQFQLSSKSAWRQLKQNWLGGVALIASYLVMISSMLLAQLKLYLAGIFTWQQLQQAVGTTVHLVEFESWQELMRTYGFKLVETLSPTKTLLALILLVWMMITAWSKLNRAARWWWLSWVTAPLWLFVIHVRTSPHMLIAFELPILFMLALALTSWWQRGQKFFGSRWLVAGVVALYLLGQGLGLKYIRSQDTCIYTYQTGVMLHNELRLIDATYQDQAGQPFSVSVWGTPYEYYITWAYLYDWYGQDKYGYVPTYFGTSQVGKFGADLLEQANRPLKNHYLIEEPNILLQGNIYKDYLGGQDAATSLATSSAILRELSGQTESNDQYVVLFGKYRLQKRTGKQ